jgi:hypothetical protein
MQPLPMSLLSNEVDQVSDTTFYALQQQLHLQQQQVQQQQYHLNILQQPQPQPQQQQQQLFDQQQQEQQQLQKAIPTRLSAYIAPEKSSRSRLKHPQSGASQDSLERVVSANINVTVTNQMVMPANQQQNIAEHMTTQQQMQALQQQNLMLMKMLQNSGLNFSQVVDSNNSMSSMNANINYSIANASMGNEYSDVKSVTPRMVQSSLGNCTSLNSSYSNVSNAGVGFSNSFHPDTSNSSSRTSLNTTGASMNAVFPIVNTSIIGNSHQTNTETISANMMKTNNSTVTSSTMVNANTSGISNLLGMSNSGAIMDQGSSVMCSSNSAVDNSLWSMDNISDRGTNRQADPLNTTMMQPGIIMSMSSILPQPALSMKQIKSSSRISPIRATQTDIPTSSLLHQACHLYPETTAVVLSAIRLDPTSISRRVPTPATVAEDGGQTQRKRTKLEGYSLPINIALKSNASLDVLKLLCQAGPAMLVEQDGPESCNSLSTALYLVKSMEVVQLLIKSNPNSPKTLDRHSNLPLHVACFKGSSLQVVHLLVANYPSSVKQKNLNGLTALEIAQRTQKCEDAVIDYLQHVIFEDAEGAASHLDDYEDDFFD